MPLVLVPAHASAEFVHLPLDVFERHAVMFLKFPRELFRAPFNLLRVIISQLPPLLYYFSANSVPSARNSVLIHDRSPDGLANSNPTLARTACCRYPAAILDVHEKVRRSLDRLRPRAQAMLPEGAGGNSRDSCRRALPERSNRIPSF